MRLLVLTPLPSPFVEQPLRLLSEQYSDLEVLPVFYGDISHRPTWGDMPWKGLWLKESSRERIRRLSDFVEASKPDQVILGQYNRLESWWLKRYAKRKAIPAHVFFLEPLMPSNALKYRLKLIAFKKFLAGLHSVGCMGRRAFEDYSKVYKGHIYSCPYAFNLSTLLGFDGNERPGDCVTFLYSGRLSAFRDPLLAVRSFAAVNAQSTKKLRLIISGKGELEDSIIAEIKQLKIESKVTWMNDFKDWEDIRNLYRYADVLLSLGIYNTWSLTIQEAMAAGMGIVATHTTEAANELVIHGHNGFLVDHANKQAIVRAMLQYAETNNLAEQHGARSREIVGMVDARPVASRIADALGL